VLTHFVRAAAQGHEIELQTRADIDAFNALCEDMGDIDKMIPLATLDWQRDATKALRRFALLKDGALTWAQIGYTLPDGAVPATYVREFTVMTSIYNDVRREHGNH